jgi:serine/threonine protein kinase
MALAPGMKVGLYEIQDLLGTGGTGEVYCARDTRLGRTVAIKIFPPHLADDPTLRQQFEREARAISALNHPHICTLYDVGSLPSGASYMVTELVRGETMREGLKRSPCPEGNIAFGSHPSRVFSFSYGLTGFFHSDGTVSIPRYVSNSSHCRLTLLRRDHCTVCAHSAAKSQAP